MDCDSLVLSIETQSFINDLKHNEFSFDFSNLDEHHEVFRKKIKKVNGKFKIEAPMNIGIDAFICLRIEAYSFLCNDKNTNKVKGFSKSNSKVINLKIVKKV